MERRVRGEQCVRPRETKAPDEKHGGPAEAPACSPKKLAEAPAPKLPEKLAEKAPEESPRQLLSQEPIAEPKKMALVVGNPIGNLFLAGNTIQCGICEMSSCGCPAKPERSQLPETADLEYALHCLACGRLVEEDSYNHHITICADWKAIASHTGSAPMPRRVLLADLAGELHVEKIVVKHAPPRLKRVIIDRRTVVV